MGTESSFNRAKSEERLARTTSAVYCELRSAPLEERALNQTFTRLNPLTVRQLERTCPWSSTTTPLPTPPGVTINTSALGIAPSTVGSSCDCAFVELSACVDVSASGSNSALDFTEMAGWVSKAAVVLGEEIAIARSRRCVTTCGVDALLLTTVGVASDSTTAAVGATDALGTAVTVASRDSALVVVFRTSIGLGREVFARVACSGTDDDTEGV